MPALFSRLCEAPALQFLILTAARSGEVRGATWAEVDLAGLWTIPAECMKSGREHCVPLSAPAIDLLHPLEDTLLSLHAGPGVPGTVHGFRSAFRDWAEENTTFSREVKEATLAHVVENRVERAYRRGNLLDQRRKLIHAWIVFVKSMA